MRILTCTLCALTLAAAQPLLAQTPRPSDVPIAEGIASNDTLQLRYMAAAPFQGLPSDLDYGLLYAINHNVLASAAWMFNTNLQILPHLTIDIGPEAYIGQLANENRGIFAITIGGSANFDLIPQWGVSLFGTAFYGPSVLIFGQANNVYDLSAGGSIRLAPRLYAVGGYRWFRFSVQHAPADEIQNNVFVGVRWNMR